MHLLAEVVLRASRFWKLKESREGILGIMDYFQFRNIQSDTKMRDSIAGGGEPGETPTGSKM